MPAPGLWITQLRSNQGAHHVQSRCRAWSATYRRARDGRVSPSLCHHGQSLPERRRRLGATRGLVDPNQRGK